MPVRKTVYDEPVPHLYKDADNTHNRLAHLVFLRYVLSSMAYLVQLDSLPAHDKLSSYVRPLQRDGYYTRCQYPLSSSIFHQKSSGKP